MAKRKKSEKAGAPAWMLTYGDMTTLLLVFFVMLIAAGDFPIVKTMIILSAFEGKLGLMKGGQSMVEGEFENMGQRVESLPATKKGRSLEKSKKKAISYFQPKIKSKRVKIKEDERGITVSLMTETFFEPGKAEVNYDAIRGILENVRMLIDQTEFEGGIRIEGHTDERPYQGTDFKDNWDLSAARAWSVLDALGRIPSLTEFNDDKVSIVGYGDTKPDMKNDTPENRAWNRRVDIVLLRKGD